MYCQYCGKKIDDNAAFCPMCGAKQRSGRTTAGYNRSQTGSQSGSGGGVKSQAEIGQSRATICFVLGIISAASTLFGLFPVSIVCGIIGLYYADVAKRCGYTGGNRTAGFVLSIIGVALGGIVFIYVMIAAIACAA